MTDEHTAERYVESPILAYGWTTLESPIVFYLHMDVIGSAVGIARF